MEQINSDQLFNYNSSISLNWSVLPDDNRGLIEYALKMGYELFEVAAITGVHFEVLREIIETNTCSESVLHRLLKFYFHIKYEKNLIQNA